VGDGVIAIGRLERADLRDQIGLRVEELEEVRQGIGDHMRIGIGRNIAKTQPEIAFILCVNYSIPFPRCNART
jgi:hypothetical protein